jgi:hypothetical protein
MRTSREGGQHEVLAPDLLDVGVQGRVRAVACGRAAGDRRSQKTELAHRTSDGIDVYLFWDQPSSRVTVSVFDERTNNGFELEVDKRAALDAFNHPFAYAAQSNLFDPTASSDPLAA